ncbi:hypothetical protein BJ508DRAFT_381634 [Ascobolus immersus RN42]|uniref:Uncharacterized protein n=1 Tax=Ascobolus immersus RN42 TaxID=1160509 RepID=A0A3N4HK51_ASCIM|nr:hypothetical protein BJ508DRAFT_381634 [Ascobolus immersus RN42]
MSSDEQQYGYSNPHATGSETQQQQAGSSNASEDPRLFSKDGPHFLTSPNTKAWRAYEELKALPDTATSSLPLILDQILYSPKGPPSDWSTSHLPINDLEQEADWDVSSAPVYPGTSVSGSDISSAPPLGSESVPWGDYEATVTTTTIGAIAEGAGGHAGGSSISGTEEGSTPMVLGMQPVPDLTPIDDLRFACTVPGCSFSRRVYIRQSLRSHIDEKHKSPNPPPPAFFCKTEGCPESKTPFERITNLLDHYWQVHTRHHGRCGMMKQLTTGMEAWSDYRSFLPPTCREKIEDPDDWHNYHELQLCVPAVSAQQWSRLQLEFEALPE